VGLADFLRNVERNAIQEAVPRQKPVGELDLASSGVPRSRKHESKIVCSELHAHASVGMAPCIDDITNIACFAVFASQKNGSLSGRRRSSPTAS